MFAWSDIHDPWMKWPKFHNPLIPKHPETLYLPLLDSVGLCSQPLVHRFSFAGIVFFNRQYQHRDVPQAFEALQRPEDDPEQLEWERIGATVTPPHRIHQAQRHSLQSLHLMFSPKLTGSGYGKTSKFRQEKIVSSPTVLSISQPGQERESSNHISMGEEALRSDSHTAM